MALLIRDLAKMGMHNFVTWDEERLLKVLQNIAAVLIQMKHYELALGYANAAIRLHPFSPPKKAVYRAAQCCSALGKHHALMFYANPLMVCFALVGAGCLSRYSCEPGIHKATLYQYDFVHLQLKLCSVHGKTLASTCAMPRLQRIEQMHMRLCCMPRHAACICGTRAHVTICASGLQASRVPSTAAERQAMTKLVVPALETLRRETPTAQESVHEAKRETARLLLANMDAFLVHNAAESGVVMHLMAERHFHNKHSYMPDDLMAEAKQYYQQGKLNDALQLWRALLQMLQAAHMRCVGADGRMHAHLFRDLLLSAAAQRKHKDLVCFAASCVR